MTKEAISTERALNLALEALELNDAPLNNETVVLWEQKIDEAIIALRVALASRGEALTSVPDWASEAIEQLAHQEPVAWAQNTTAGLYVIDHYDEWHCIPLYKSPPTLSLAQRTWVGLTHEDIKEAEWLLSAIKEYESYTLQEQLLVEGVDVFARAIEAKLKEKNSD